MESLVRNFKFWTWYYAKTDALTTVMIIVMVAITSFADGDNFFEAFFTMLPLYLILMIVMEVIVFGFTSITVLFPFAVGMGAKRSSCIVAKVLLEHIVFIINVAVAVTVLAITKPEMKQYILIAIPLAIAAMGILMLTGNLVALLSNKFGRTAGMIFYIIFVILCVFGIMLAITSDFAVNLALTLMYNTFSFGVLIAVLALLLDAGSAYLLYISVKTKDLNFSV